MTDCVWRMSGIKPEKVVCFSIGEIYREQPVVGPSKNRSLNTIGLQNGQASAPHCFRLDRHVGCFKRNHETVTFTRSCNHLLIVDPTVPDHKGALQSCYVANYGRARCASNISLAGRKLNSRCLFSGIRVYQVFAA